MIRTAAGHLLYASSRPGLVILSNGRSADRLSPEDAIRLAQDLIQAASEASGFRP